MGFEVFETPAGKVRIECPSGVHAIAPSTVELAKLLDVRPGERVLELGCGAGLLAVVAAKLGAGRVVASDIDEASCRAAEANARENGVARLVETRRGDFLEAVRGERFDLIVFNPPQTPGPVPFGPKYGGEDGLLHFRAVLPRIEANLRPGGRLLLLALSLVDRSALDALLSGFHVEERGATERRATVEEYEGYSKGLYAHLASRAASGKAELSSSGDGRFVFTNRFLRARAQHRGTRLVVNADDLGMDTGRNDGVFESFERGIVRSASLLVNGAGTDDAVRRLGELAKSRMGSLDVGLHWNLSEGKSLSGEIAGLTSPDGTFPGKKADAWQRLARAGPDVMDLEGELFAQRAFLRKNGLTPTHLDGHQHVHAFPRARVLAAAAARALGIFLRVPDESGIAVEGDPALSLEIRTIYEQAVELRKEAVSRQILAPSVFRGLAARTTTDPLKVLENMRASLASLPSNALVELMVHPAKGAHPIRDAELAALTDPSWPDWLAERGIALVSFRECLARV